MSAKQAQDLLLLLQLLPELLHGQAQAHQRGLLGAGQHARLGGQEALFDARGLAGDVISSTSAIAFWKIGSSCGDFIARRISRPGTSRRLISLVPSKMRLTRASRQ